MSREKFLLSTSLTAGKDAVPNVVSAKGVWFELSDGRRVIDASNTAAPLGHAHPVIVEAIHGAAESPAINEGWGWEPREEAAAELIKTAFRDEDWVGAVRFFISASEANDAALALSQALSGRTGIATRQRAYHGGVGLARETTTQPHWHGGLSSVESGVSAPPRLAKVGEVQAPVSARVKGDEKFLGENWDEETSRILGESAAVLLDYSQGGIYHQAEYQDRIAKAARDAGTIWIADETVTGFGRTGDWFQFQSGESRPDIVTMGKCLAAGGSAAGAMVLSKDLHERLGGRSWQTYSTFRGHPIQVATTKAHVQESNRIGLYKKAREFDQIVFDRLTRIAADHPSVRRIDGRGLHWTVELHGPSWEQWRGQEAEPMASRVASAALAEGALFATSGEQTSIFIAPPLIVSEEELGLLLDALDKALLVADEAIEQ